MLIVFLFTAFYTAIHYVDSGPQTIALFSVMALVFGLRGWRSLQTKAPAAVNIALAACFIVCTLGLVTWGANSNLGRLLLTNVPLAVAISLFLMSVGLPLMGQRPFVEAYVLQRNVTPEIRRAPAFRRVMMEMSIAWSGLFMLSACATVFLRQSAWQPVCSLGLLVAGIVFNRTYPRLRLHRSVHAPEARKIA